MKELIILPCGFKAISDIPEKFSIIRSDSLHYTFNLDKELNSHYIKSYERKNKEGTYFATSHKGKVHLELGSLEELYEVSKVFNDKGFRISYGECYGGFKRIWINKETKEINAGFFELYIHIKNKKQYYKFREILNDLKSLNYLVLYEEDDSGKFTVSSYCILA